MKTQTLEQLLSKVTPENIHHEVDTGPAVGNETWSASEDTQKKL